MHHPNDAAVLQNLLQQARPKHIAWARAMHYRTVEAQQNPMFDKRTGLGAAEDVSWPDHQTGDLISRQVDHYQHKPIIAQGLPARATTRPVA